MKKTLVLLLCTAICVFATTPSTGVSVQWFSTMFNDTSCWQWPVVFDWVRGAPLLGNFTGNYVTTCSEMDQIVVDTTNGRTFYYAANEPESDSWIYTYDYRDDSEVATTPRMTSKAPTPYLHTPEAMAYDPDLDLLIIVDLWNYTLYYLNYKTGDLDPILSVQSSIPWACTYPIYTPQTDSLYCAWSYLYQVNLTEQSIGQHELYPPLEHDATMYLQIEGIDNDDLSTSLVIIYFNPNTSEWDNVVISTTTWQVTPFDSSDFVFNPINTDDEMLDFQVFASFSGGIYAAQVRGSGDGMSPSYLRLFQWIDGRLILTYTSNMLPPIVDDIDSLTTPYTVYFWDGFTFTSAGRKTK